MRPRYRADDVGSLLRRQDLLEPPNNPDITCDQRTSLADRRKIWKDA
jgi:hypothetical protein